VFRYGLFDFHFSVPQGILDFYAWWCKFADLFLLCCGWDERWKREKTYVPYDLTAGVGTICFLGKFALRFFEIFQEGNIFHDLHHFVFLPLNLMAEHL
jgi:hypothetical protein